MADFNTHGGYFSPQGYMKVEEGGSHEENPNGGVQIGVDPNGVPNMLEENEPVYQDYVYSDNIEATAEMLEKHNLPTKYAGKLYSKIADIYVEEAEERPMDAVSNNGLEIMLGRLADAQDEQKQIKEQKELEDELSKLSPEELAELEQMLMAQEGEQQPVDEMPQEQIPVMANGGLIRTFGDGTPGRVESFGETYARHFPFRTVYGNDYDLSYLDPSRMSVKGNQRNHATNGVVPVLPEINFDIEVPNVSLDDEINSILKPIDASTPKVDKLIKKQNNDESQKKLPTWMRYAGLGQNLAAGLANLAQQPDHYELQRVSPHYPTVQAPNLQDAVYRPTDVNRSVNDVMSSGAGSIRAALNSGAGPGVGALLVSLDNNITGNLGTAREQVAAANNAQYNQVLGINNQNEIQRKNFAYQQALARAQAQDRAAQYNSMLDMREQMMNNEAEAQWAQAVSQPLNALAHGLAGIGQENFAFNQVDPRLFYGYGYRDKSGKWAYDPKMNSGALGGILLRKLGQ